MMSPAATSTATPAKAGAFDVATLFVADKAAREEASLALATAAKKEGVEFFASIGLNDALVKVSLSSQLGTWGNLAQEIRDFRRVKFSPFPFSPNTQLFAPADISRH